MREEKKWFCMLYPRHILIEQNYSLNSMNAYDAHVMMEKIFQKSGNPFTQPA